jgi:3-oxoacyl-[acyl-carrier-protein] synthase II
MELLAIEDTFKNNEVYFSSTKSRTGHCLGAAGSIELAISVLSLKKGMVYATINTKNPVETRENIHGVYTENRKVDFGYVVSNSFAFAGNTSSIVLKRYEV